MIKCVTPIKFIIIIVPKEKTNDPFKGDILITSSSVFGFFSSPFGFPSPTIEIRSALLLPINETIPLSELNIIL